MQINMVNINYMIQQYCYHIKIKSDDYSNENVEIIILGSFPECNEIYKQSLYYAF